MGDLTNDHCCLTKNLDQIWHTASQHANQNSRITADVQRARTLDVRQITGPDFLRECAWAIYGAGFRFTVLQRHWPDLEKAYLHWDAPNIVEHQEEVERQALKFIGHHGKVTAILSIARILNSQGWSAIRSTLLDLLSWDADGNPAETQAFIDYLDGFPWVGKTLASFISKNIGVRSIKPDIWMLRLAKWLGYQPGKPGVWDMARDLQSMTQEKINVIDTVLWNWARVPQECLEKIQV